LPVSVLVLIHTSDGQVLLMERADAPASGSRSPARRMPAKRWSRPRFAKCARKTGLDATQFDLTQWGIENRYEIYDRWRHRYAPG